MIQRVENAASAPGTTTQYGHDQQLTPESRRESVIDGGNQCGSQITVPVVLNSTALKTESFFTIPAGINKLPGKLNRSRHADSDRENLRCGKSQNTFITINKVILDSADGWK